MKNLTFITGITLIFLNQAQAADGGWLKHGMIALDGGPVISAEAYVVLPEIGRHNFHIQELQGKLETQKMGMELSRQSSFAHSDLDEAGYKSLIADTEREIAEARANKAKVFGPNVEKLERDLEEKAVRLGKMLTAAKADGEIVAKKTAAFTRLEAEVQAIGKELLSARDKFKELSRVQYLRDIGKRGKVVRAGIVALPIAAAAVVLGGSTNSAEASQLEAKDLPERNHENENRQGVEIGVLDAQ